MEAAFDHGELVVTGAPRCGYFHVLREKDRSWAALFQFLVFDATGSQTPAARSETSGFERNAAATLFGFGVIS